MTDVLSLPVLVSPAQVTAVPLLPVMKCKVMILSDAIPNRNGVGTYYHDLMEHLRDHLDQVDMIPARANCIFKKNWVSIPLPGDNSQHLYFPNVLRILKEIQREKPDVLIAPTIGPFALLARLLSKYKGIPLIFGYHTSLDKLAGLYWKGRLGKLSDWYLKRASRIMFRDARAVVVNTLEMADEAERFGAKTPWVMGTSIAYSMLNEPVNPYQGHLKRVLYGGRLAKEKNVMAVVEAAALHPDVEFALAGEGPLRPELEARAADLPNVHFLGWLEREDLRREIDRADVVVLPSTFESFGSIALEVMARERIMLVSKNCGILQWSALAEGLAVIQDHETVSDALTRLQTLAPSQRRGIARKAWNATRSMNAVTMKGWLELFRSFR
jgi:glycosyltransferase involved in cell wall biosynthesis